MCKLTIVDFKYFRVSDLAGILSLNAYSGNQDGFGFFNISNNSIVKTSKSFLESSDLLLQLPKNLSGIYHCRRASSKVLDIKDSHAHPHEIDDIVVSHNGTFTEQPELNKIIDIDYKEDTDSIKYTKALAYYARKGDGINAEAIKNALNYFIGPFVLLQFDKLAKEKVIWISIGMERFLSVLYIKETLTNKIVGCIFNTSEDELLQYGFILNTRTAGKYISEFEKLEENTIYSYHVGKFLLVKEGKIEQKVVKVIPLNPQAKSVVDEYCKFDDLSVILEKNNLSYKDLYKLFFILTGTFLNDLNDITYKELNEFLYYILKSNSNNKIKIWRKLLDLKSEEELYKIISYPYFLNSKQRLFRLINELRSKNEIPLMQ